jgi:thiamine biosynthesis lipoprotein ApbE
MSPNSTQILRSLTCLSLAATAVSGDAVAQPVSVWQQHGTEWQQHGAAWSFQYENVLGTSMDVLLRAANFNEAERAEAALLASIDRQNLILSTWNRNSELSQWAAQQDKSVKVSRELLEVLALFDDWREQTNGALNASAETAGRLWQRAASEDRLPTQFELAAAIKSMQQQHWQLDAANGTATHLTESPLVLASFTKGYVAGHAADAALGAGASGVVLNIGGDVVVRGNVTQRIDIANPLADAENDAPMDQIVLRDGAVATSGSYRRGFGLTSTQRQRPEFSHIVDPRTAEPVSHILSSTVIAGDPVTAGALATAFSVLTVDESRSLAAKRGGAEYLLLTSNGERVASDGWSRYRTPMLRAVSYPGPAAAAAAAPPVAAQSGWNEGYELDINLELARIDDYRFHRPYVAVWVEDADHVPVRTIALWFGKMRYLDELRSWYHGEQRSGNGDNIIRTISSATRSPGRYTLKWDGKDDKGNVVKGGKYTICIEAAREHGTYQIIRQEMDFNGKPQQATLPGGTEIGAASLDYHKR